MNGPGANSSGFERIKRRESGVSGGDWGRTVGRDPEGRASLFSRDTPLSANGHGDQTARRRRHGSGTMKPLAFTACVRCGRCERQTTMTLPGMLRQAVPGVHLPWVRRPHGSLMRCPACRRMAWMSISVSLPRL